MQMKKIINNLLKLALAIGIIYWLIRNGKLDPESALKLFSNFSILIPVLIILIFQIFITSIRWKALLNIKSNKIQKYNRIFLIQWIGQFFSSALPGAVTGDIIKLGYIKKMDETLSRKYLFLSVLLDRVIGLIGLLLISGISSIIYYNDLMKLNTEMHNIVMINLLLLLGGLFGIGLFCLPASFIDKVKEIIKIKKITELLDGLKSIRISKTLFIKLLLLSSFSQILAIFVFHLINKDFYESTVRLQDLLTIIPIGQLAIAIPISPAGLGVGHLAYQKLFSFIHQSNGATLFNNFWLLTLSVNILGFIPYVFLPRVPPDLG